jgi:hypothetical protein
MNKYHARKVKLDGYTFDSQREAERYSELKLMESAGLIKNLIVHPRFELFPKKGLPNGRIMKAIRYTADFQYIDRDGNIIVEDVKGMITRDASLRMNLFQRQYVGLIFEIIR